MARPRRSRDPARTPSPLRFAPVRPHPAGGLLRRLLRLLPGVVLAASWPVAHASLVLTGTRLIYRAAAQQARIDVVNVGRQPQLMQAWIDAGNPDVAPQRIQVPFVLTPPMARIDPGQSQTLSVVFTGPALPADRESVFWLNVLDIPPEPHEHAGRNYIQFAIRTRIKLLYRPASLHGGPQQAMHALRWREVCEARHCALRVDNPTPYAIAIVELRALAGKRLLAGPLQGTALPFQSRSWALASPQKVRTVKYAVVNDYGALVHARALVGR